MGDRRLCSNSESNPILIGATVSLEGKYGEPSLMIQNAFRLWEQEVNLRGGLLGRPVKLILYDDKSQKQHVGQLYQKLIFEDKVDLVFSPYGKGEKILVIDDIQEQRDIASMLLTKLGYSVSTVSSGEKAVEYMKTGSADLLILDMIMDPGIDGLQTYKNILELHSGQKAIIASGFSETDRVKAAHKLGAGQYVRKPYALKQLGMAVKTELRKQSFQPPSANHP